MWCNNSKYVNTTYKNGGENMESDQIWNQVAKFMQQLRGENLSKKSIIQIPGQKNAKNELVEAVEVRTEDTIYLVKVSTKLADRIENYDEDDELIIDDAVEPIKGLDLDEDMDDDDDDDAIDKLDSDSGEDDDDEDADEKDFSDDEDDEDDED